MTDTDIIELLARQVERICEVLDTLAAVQLESRGNRAEGIRRGLASMYESAAGFDATRERFESGSSTHDPPGHSLGSTDAGERSNQALNFRELMDVYVARDLAHTEKLASIREEVAEIIAAVRRATAASADDY